MISPHAPKVSAFFCSICEEESTQICLNCTKDTCQNHLCAKCASCSDCCSCELSLDSDEALRHPLVVRAPEPEPDLAPDPALEAEHGFSE